MRRTFIGVAAVAILALILVGCGSSDGGTATESPSATTPAQSPTAESPAAAWTTVATMSSSDPTNDMGLRVSEPFTAGGDVQFVLDMPEGAETDGIIAAVFPADQEITVEAASTAESVALAVGLPTQIISGLDGSYVMLVTPSTTKDWTVEVQTQQ